MTDTTEDIAFSDDDAQDIEQRFPVPRPKGGKDDLKLGALDIEAKVYDKRAQTALQRIAGIVGLSVNVSRVGIVQSAMRYAVVTDPAHPHRPEQKWGVAARLVVAATEIKFKGDVTIPVVAASAELGLANAQIGIHVRGYTGDLADLMPAPSSLDVETYAEYIAAFKKIQAKVFGDEAHQDPMLLEAEAQS